MGNQPNLKKAKYHVDLKSRSSWAAPSLSDPDFGAKLLTMPNIPKPLHLLAPRVFMGSSEWNKVRRQVYADEVCAICKKTTSGAPGWGQHNAHEVYDIDYKTGVSVYRYAVNLCKASHLLCIHTGRALTMFKNKISGYDKNTIIKGAEEAFSIVSAYNNSHPDLPPLRLYSAWLFIIDNKELHDEMVKLVSRYNVKFWKDEKIANWQDWKLVYEGREFLTPYKNYEEWEKTMEKNNKEQAFSRSKWKRYDSLDAVDLSPEDLARISRVKLPKDF